MRRGVLILGAGMVLAAILVGVLSVSGSGVAAADPTTTTDPPAAPSSTRAITVTVNGHGETAGTPDVAQLSLGVTSRAKSASDALHAMSDRANKLIGVLTDAGVASKDVQTVGLSIQPVTDNSGAITGYEASTSVVARVGDIGNVGSIVDAAAKQVGDGVRLDGVVFSISDTDSLASSARAAAVKQARAHAEDLAKAAGLQLGEVQSISEAGSSTPMPLAAGDTARASTVPVEPGTQSVTADVTVVYTLH